jgi:hypothetical protein
VGEGKYYLHLVDSTCSTALIQTMHTIIHALRESKSENCKSESKDSFSSTSLSLQEVTGMLGDEDKIKKRRLIVRGEGNGSTLYCTRLDSVSVQAEPRSSTVGGY